jgi:hypothetical protein
MAMSEGCADGSGGEACTINRPLKRSRRTRLDKLRPLFEEIARDFNERFREEPS